MSVNLSYPRFKAWDRSGNFLRGGLLYTYEAGSSTEKSTYSDSALTSVNANPVVLDTLGEAMIYYRGSIKLVLKDANDVVIWTEDNMSGSNEDTGFFYPDKLEADQGAASLGGNSTVKDFVDSLAGSKNGTIVFAHDGAADTTEYTFQSSETIPSYVSLQFQNGARLIDDANNATVTIDGPIEVGQGQQIFDFSNGTGKVIVNDQTVMVDWFGMNSPEDAFAAVTSSYGTIEFSPKLPYLASSACQITASGIKVIGNMAYLRASTDIDVVDVNPDATADGAGDEASIIIEDLIILNTDATPTKAGIKVRDVALMEIRNCRLFSHKYGVDVATDESVLIDNCQFFNNEIGIYAPLFFTGSANGGYVIRNCIIDKQTNGVYGIKNESALESMTIENNRFIGDFDYDIHTVTGTAAPAANCTNWKILGNYFYDGDTGDYYIYVDYVSGTLDHMFISGNYFDETTPTAIYLEDTIGAIITGNYFKMGGGLIINCDDDCEKIYFADNGLYGVQLPPGLVQLNAAEQVKVDSGWRTIYYDAGVQVGQVGPHTIANPGVSTSAATVTTLGTITVPLNSMGLYGGIRVIGWGETTFAGAGTMLIQMDIFSGLTVVAMQPAVAFTASGHFSFEFDLVADGSNSQQVYNSKSQATLGGGAVQVWNTNAMTFMNLTGPFNLAVQAQVNNAVNNIELVHLRSHWI